ncbi:hypothetical protein ZHAS_00018571 [Anopheles sinensis]|uniref:Uncharacterized protein n=1 Tax=Anopheles sinensis TaxID=74873 RepID=A0A084WJY6_ANOSI|nr:hypothetical protein ZHAS_00018571 [Anopheles sinensis]
MNFGRLSILTRDATFCHAPQARPLSFRSIIDRREGRPKGIIISFPPNTKIPMIPTPACQGAIRIGFINDRADAKSPSSQDRGPHPGRHLGFSSFSFLVLHQIRCYSKASQLFHSHLGEPGGRKEFGAFRSTGKEW